MMRNRGSELDIGDINFSRILQVHRICQLFLMMIVVSSWVASR